MKRIVLLSAVVASAAFAGPTQASFTPTSYQYPITRISLFKADYTGEQVLYRCEAVDGGAPVDCLVDVTSPMSIKAIEDAAQNLAIDPGEYTQVVLSSCAPGIGGSETIEVKVSGTVSVGSQTFSTSTAADGGMAEGSVAEPTSIRLGCGGARAVLATPLVVAAGTNQTLTLMVDLTNVTWTDAMASGGMGGCKADNGPGQDICTAFPFIVPFVGAGAPTFERYLISHSASSTMPAIEDANAYVNLAVDDADHVFYVAVAPYYSATSPGGGDPMKGGPDYNTSTRTLSTNADGSIAFQTGGDVNDNRVGFPAFQRSTHVGVCKNEGAASPSWNYQAFKQ